MITGQRWGLSYHRRHHKFIDSDLQFLLAVFVSPGIREEKREGWISQRLEEKEMRREIGVIEMRIIVKW